jgi:hypothetical protein
MRVYLFLSTARIGTCAFTSDQSGANLPPDLGPWAHPRGASFATEGWLKDEVVIAIKQDGYHVQRPATADPG